MREKTSPPQTKTRKKWDRESCWELGCGGLRSSLESVGTATGAAAEQSLTDGLDVVAHILQGMMVQNHATIKHECRLQHVVIDTLVIITLVTNKHTTLKICLLFIMGSLLFLIIAQNTLSNHNTLNMRANFYSSDRGGGGQKIWGQPVTNYHFI